MPTLIDRHGVRADDWRLHEQPDDQVPADAALLVPLQAWLAHRDTLRTRHARLGVLLAPSDDPAELAADLDALQLVAVGFPAFTDGRGYSIARLLRERHGWRGELRAVGEVLRDQLFYMSRCGFDSFALAEGEPAQEALRHFTIFSEPYQGAVDRGPLFARRPAAAAASPAFATCAASGQPAAQQQQGGTP